ncbi:MAG: hypothetical protein ACE5FD_12520 [Anaerolineae bacterium]
MKPQKQLIRPVLLLVALLALGLAACGGSDDSHDEHSHNDNMTMEMPVQIPNNGAVIAITSPADGATFSSDEDVLVTVQVENFTLNEANHWHVYVDDVSYGMVMGGGLSQSLRHLEPGTHEIRVALSDETHAELEEGDSVTITVK